jgi:purine nucleosidase
MKIHLDTDIAGDTDDACALAMVLGWPGADLVGVTTVADADGRRAGYARFLLDLAGRDDVPVAAGAGASLAGHDMGGLPDHDRYWGDVAVPPRPSPVEDAVDLLDASIDAGATVVAVGPWTNLALLERQRPGRLRTATVVAMGGWVWPPRAGLPPWGPDKDWNVQCDPAAARLVAEHADLTLATLPATMQAQLRAVHLPRLAACGTLGGLLARQALEHATEHSMGTLGRAHAGLPDHLLNFQYDPVACAVALGWDGGRVEEVRVRPTDDGGALWFEPRPDGRLTRVVSGVDGDAFADRWLAAVEAAQRRTAG